jgi:glycerol kinase
MSAYTNKAHICRATIEATCFQTRAILEAMAKDSKKELSVLRVDGGMTNSGMSCCRAAWSIMEIHFQAFFSGSHSG